MTREEALKWFKDHAIIDETKDGQAHEWAIKALSEQTGWIPCSERLPDVGQDVIFCDEKWTEEGCLRADGDWWQFRWSTVRGKEEVTAWMPLPDPWKGGAE